MNWSEGKFILIDKPKNWTSFDVVKKIRNHINSKIGHAGTLDPLATGLLILATGKFTKKIDEVQGQDKIYEGVFEIGKTTPSFDLETNFDSEHGYSHLSIEDVKKMIPDFIGEITQFPPAHSAVRIDGERAYKKARKNEEVKLRPRQVSVYSFDLLESELPEIRFKIRCSKGTYIRSIANDLGVKLGVGAYLKELKRTAIGEFRLEDAFSIESFLEKYPKNETD